MKKPGEIFFHKLELLFGDIEQIYEDETGYYLQLADGEWKKLSLTDTEKDIDAILKNQKKISTDSQVPIYVVSELKQHLP